MYLFGVNIFLKLGPKIYPSKTPRMDLKSYQRHRNGLSMYTAWHLFVLLSPRNKVKLLTQRQNIEFVWGNKQAIPCGAIFISQASERPQAFRFFQRLCLLTMPFLDEVKNECCFEFFWFSRK